MAEWRYYYAVPGLEVSRGGGVRRTYDDSRTPTGKSLYPKMLERQVDNEGNLFVEIRVPNRVDLRIDEMVTRCFLSKPGQGQTLLIHKDMDKEHCWAGNLEWDTPEQYEKHYNLRPVDGFRLLKGNLYVSPKGEVKVNGVVLNVCDFFSDPDMGRLAAVNPFVEINRERLFIDKLVADAFLPQPSSQQAYLLHKDGDYKNCSSDNLDWVEYSNPEYQEYQEQRNSDIEERLKELNN